MSVFCINGNLFVWLSTKSLDTAVHQCRLFPSGRCESSTFTAHTRAITGAGFFDKKRSPRLGRGLPGALVSLAPMPEHRGQNIAQSNANNEKTNGKMRFHVTHYPALLGLFGNDAAQYGPDRTRLIETKQAFSKGAIMRFFPPYNE